MRWLATLLLSAVVCFADTRLGYPGVSSGSSVGAQTGVTLPSQSFLFRYSAGDSLAAATFTRASTATYRDSNGVLQTASSGAARDNHYALDPVSGLYKRTLLLEGQRTNLSLRSQEFDNASWVKEAGVTVTANSSVAPDGTTTADRMEYAGGASSLYQAITFTAAAHTFSIWAKATSGSSAPFRLRFYINPTPTFSADLTATDTWQRFSLTFTATASAGFFSVHSNSANAAVDIQIWQGQCEPGAFASSDIPTVASTVTRAADSLSFPFTAVPQEMTVFARALDLGIYSQSNIALVKLGTLGVTSPYVLIYISGANIQAYHSANNTSALTTAVGEAMECRAFMAANGNIQLGLSRNGAAETLSTTTSGPAIESSWNADVVRLNEWSGGVGFVAIRDLIIFKGIRDLTYFRARIAP